MKLVKKFKSLTDDEITRIVEKSQSVLWLIMIFLIAIWIIGKLILLIIGYYTD